MLYLYCILIMDEITGWGKSGTSICFPKTCNKRYYLKYSSEAETFNGQKRTIYFALEPTPILCFPSCGDDKKKGLMLSVTKNVG